MSIEDDNVDPTVTIGGESWELIEATVESTTASTPNYADLVVTPSPDVSPPATPQLPKDEGGYLGKDFSLSINTELRTDTPRPEKSLILTGIIANMTARGDYTYELIATDPRQQRFASKSFMNSSIDISPAVPKLKKILNSEAYYYDSLESGQRKLKVSKVVEKIMKAANISNYQLDLSDSGTVIGGTKQGIDLEVTFSSWEVKVSDTLDRIQQASNSTWYFDRKGTFHFGALDPNEDIFAYNLEYITETSAGKQSPPYRSVKVIGDGVVSKKGWTKSAIINENPVTATGSISTEDVQLAEPTFVYRNYEINTKREAVNAKTRLIDKLEKQRGGGTITVVGFPEIRPYDAVVMPNSTEQPMGGARYGVDKVVHEVTANNGFLTTIHCGGLVSSQKVLTEDEVPSVSGDLIQDWAEENFRSGRAPSG